MGRGTPAAANGEEGAIFFKEKGGFVAAGGLEERVESPNETVVAFKHGGLYDFGWRILAFLFGIVLLSPSAEIGFAVVGCGPPDIVAVGAFQVMRLAPSGAVFREYCIAEVFVDVVIFARKGVVTSPPSAGVDEELVFEDKKMGVAHVAT